MLMGVQGWGRIYLFRPKITFCLLPVRCKALRYQSSSIVFVCFTDEKPFEFTTLLHTYFRVPDVTKTTVSGLTGLTYVDKVHVHWFIFARHPKLLAYSFVIFRDWLNFIREKKDNVIMWNSSAFLISCISLCHIEKTYSPSSSSLRILYASRCCLILLSLSLACQALCPPMLQMTVTSPLQLP